MKQLALTTLLLVLFVTHCLHAQDATQAAPVGIPPGASGPYRLASLGTDASSAKASMPGTEFEAAKIIARVGDEVVLAGDLYGQVNQFLQSRINQIPEEQRGLLTTEMLNERRWQLMQQVLPQVIDGKLVYLDFLRSIPAERVPDIQDSLYKAFDEQRLPTLIQEAKVQTAADLDSLLRSFGSSLDQQRRSFAEQLAAMQWKERNASSSKEISHEDLVSYYRSHIEDYRILAKARWEQLTSLDSETFSREKSKRLVGQMGNEVWHGAAFDAVAKRSSQGAMASLGGKYDWTTKGSLRSEEINKAVFSLPIGELSPIIEDEMGCHIVRVIERHEEAIVPFAEVQDAIRKKIRENRSELALKSYVDKLRGQFPVWTVFDNP